MLSANDFPPCPICSSADWALRYEGPVRDGEASSRQRAGVIARCGGCGVDRLGERACLKDEDYSSDYRDHIGQGHDLARHYRMHDELVRFTFDVLWPVSLRDKTIADIGCGGGSLLDNVRGLTSNIVAIDPDRGFAPDLQRRGYRWFESAAKASDEFEGRVDIAFSIQVIEHVSDPRDFLDGIRKLLKSEGLLILSTPNRNDILLDLMPQVFPSHFYRTHHRWYFDQSSLAEVARLAGLRVQSVHHVHRYGMSNTLLWLRERKPPGRVTLDVIDSSADSLWRSWLEAQGRSDNLYLILSPL
jgi:2-polyprenyl-3-methyl-5-hydroxy-6-metoxy-1,4-benzoquinol methylase